MPRDVQRFRKTYSYYRPRPQEVVLGAGGGGGIGEEVIHGLDWKQSVLVATVSNITLSPAPVTVDGVTLVADARVLVKNQTTPAENGIYYYSAGNLVRSLDASDPALTSAAAVFVESGSTNGSCAFVLTTQDPIVVGTTGQTWVKFAGAGNTGLNVSIVTQPRSTGALTSAKEIVGIAALNLSSLSTLFSTATLNVDFEASNAISDAYLDLYDWDGKTNSSIPVTVTGTSLSRAYGVAGIASVNVDYIVNSGYTGTGIFKLRLWTDNSEYPVSCRFASIEFT